MFHADLHIHSKFSRACSKDCDIEHLSWWALRKGLRVLGTGDFTHPAWAAELRETLVQAEPGLFRIRPDLEKRLHRDTPASCAGTVRFMLSVEISTIYRRDDRTRKVHHLLYAPGFEAADRITAALARIGNLASDGRPILGLDSRDLLDITLSAGPGCFLVPAHVWTPWFAVLGSKSGFDAVRDCYADLADHIFAVETGLSSDPPMNWACSSLDGYRLVSNSDAHSPPMLGREATVFDTEMDYFSIAAALRTGTRPGGHGRVLPRGGQVPPGRAPQVRGAGRARADQGARHHLPAVRQAPHRRRAAPGGRARRPPARVPAARRRRVHQPDPAALHHGRDPGHRAEEQEGDRRGRAAGRRARTRAEHPARRPARRRAPGGRVAARRGHRPAAPRRGHQGRGVRRRVRHDPPVPAGRAGRGGPVQPGRRRGEKERCRTGPGVPAPPPGSAPGRDGTLSRPSRPRHRGDRNAAGRAGPGPAGRGHRGRPAADHRGTGQRQDPHAHLPDRPPDRRPRPARRILPGHHVHPARGPGGAGPAGRALSVGGARRPARGDHVPRPGPADPARAARGGRALPAVQGGRRGRRAPGRDRAGRVRAGRAQADSRARTRSLRRR